MTEYPKVIGDIMNLPEAERDRILKESGQTLEDYMAEEAMVEDLAAQNREWLKKHPDAPEFPADDIPDLSTGPDDPNFPSLDSIKGDLEE